MVSQAAQPPIALNSAAPASLQLPQFANANVNAIANPPSVDFANQIAPNTVQLPGATTLPPGMVVSGPIINGSATTNPSLAGFTPDFGATQTFVFPGDANGPDLTAQPTDFIPVTNLAEIIRFDVYPNWVKSRWKRISNQSRRERIARPESCARDRNQHVGLARFSNLLL